ncbi:MAG: hypothetical protein KAI79_18010 [Bacteroidales bacterium]|nr:hypothetical protein [Bacteroidales bacterium]
MGWFSNPDCPRCGRETSLDTDGLTDFYTCFPCRRELKQEKEEKEDLMDRITKLEEALKSKN